MGARRTDKQSRRVNFSLAQTALKLAAPSAAAAVLSLSQLANDLDGSSGFSVGKCIGRPPNDH